MNVQFNMLQIAGLYQEKSTGHHKFIKTPSPLKLIGYVARPSLGGGKSEQVHLQTSSFYVADEKCRF